MPDANPLQPNSCHAVLMLHGLCGSPVEMGGVPKALEQLGFSVRHLEIEGYSASLTDPKTSPRWEDWCAQVEEQISLLKAQFATVSICGLSMGATLALAVATRRTDILGIVALSPILRYDGWAISWYAPVLQIPFWLGFKNWSYKETEPYGLKNLEMRRRIAKNLEKAGVAEVGAAAIPARHLDAAKKMMRYVRSNLKQVTANLLVIHAIDDESAAPRNAEIILSQVSSELRKVIWLGDCYHIITFDNEREIVVNESARFVTKLVRNFDEDQRHRCEVKRMALKDRRG